MKLLKKPKNYNSFISKLPIKIEPCVLCALVEDHKTYDYHIIHTERSIYEMFENNEMSIKLRGSSTYNFELCCRSFTHQRFINLGKILILDSSLVLDESETSFHNIRNKYSAKFYNHIIKTYNRNRIINNILISDE